MFNHAELIEMFPREFDKLNVAIQINDETNFRAIYFLSLTQDIERNWKLYHEWIDKKNSSPVNIPIPKEIDLIYHKNYNYFTQGHLNWTDMILLHFQIIKKGDIIELNHIQRNKNPKFKGIGSEFYRNLEEFVFNLGYKYMTLYPFPSSLRTFWKNQGLVPAYETGLNIHKDYLVDTLSQKFI